MLYCHLEFFLGLPTQSACHYYLEQKRNSKLLSKDNVVQKCSLVTPVILVWRLTKLGRVPERWLSLINNHLPKELLTATLHNTMPGIL